MDTKNKVMATTVQLLSTENESPAHYKISWHFVYLGSV
jgi:hypothetical protein